LLCEGEGNQKAFVSGLRRNDGQRKKRGAIYSVKRLEDIRGTGPRGKTSVPPSAAGGPGHKRGKGGEKPQNKNYP